MGSELELKFALPAALRDRLEHDGVADRRERIRSSYFDTPDGELTSARMAVRVRLHGERWVQTVKADTGDRFERFEWERPVAGPAPQRDALPPESTPQGALAHRSFARWQPLFETDFERCARRIEPAPGLAIELARDVGEVRCGRLHEPIRELELECLAGMRAAFFAWALEWARHEEACLTWPTKNERGLRLAGRLPAAPAPVRADATAPAPGPDTSPGEAARAVLRACIGHACANVEPVLASAVPEGPHQLRVALRRLRAALRFFDLRARDGGTWKALDREAATLAALAGRVRDLDVLESGLLTRLRTRLPDDAALDTLARTLGEARDSARADLRRALAGPATTQLVLRALALAEGLAGGTDRARGDPPAPPDDPRPHGHDLAGFARRRIDSLLRRVRRRAARAADTTGWHRTRIAVKELRYALEFAGAACPYPADAARAASLLADWQDTLGTAQDLATARESVATLMTRPDVAAGEAARAIALVEGWNARACDASEALAPEGGRRALEAVRAALRRAGHDPAPESRSPPATKQAHRRRVR
jgi:inorganic triphosphatase YgiF